MTDVVEDLSAFVISGRVKSHLHGDPEHETSERTPAQVSPMVSRPSGSALRGCGSPSGPS